VINCAGYTGKPNVDACELHKAECLSGNAVLPGTIATACRRLAIPWGHVSSGCIYTGSRSDGRGFTETDPPNFTFRTNNSSFYSGSKALGEECLEHHEDTYIWRLRIPFNHEDGPRNYLSKLMRYERLLRAENSISHLDESVAACWQLWERGAPFGIYHVTNTGSVKTERVVQLIKQHLGIDRDFNYFDDEQHFLSTAAETPRSNCILDNTKLTNTGIQITEVEEAIERSLKKWKKE
jgi:UDP-glucose 4,6-dehydratase